MDAHEVIEELKSAVVEAEKAGQTSIPTSGLLRYLSSLSESVNAHPAENVAARELWLEQHKHMLSDSGAWSLEMFRSVLEAGQSALKAATIINGGAAAAILAFIGGILTSETAPDQLAAVSPLGAAWFCFMIGLGAAGTASGVRYLSQFAYRQEHEKREAQKTSAQRWRVGADTLAAVSAAVGASSFVLFFVGSWKLAQLFQAV